MIMSKKIIALILVLAFAFVGALSAQDGESIDKAQPSVFDIGLIMNYSYANIQAREFSAYVPTLRFQWNALPWLGISATGYSRGQEYAALVVEAVLRAPLGLIEPYVATGPGILFAFTDDVPASGTSNFAYNFRAGFDINITDWFSIGPGITLLIPDVRHFFGNIETLDIEYLKETSLIGIGAKLRF